MLITLIVVMSILLFIILWLLLAPVIIYADSDENRYYIRMIGVFRLSPIFRGDDFRLRVEIPFYTFYIDPTKEDDKEKKVKKKKPDKERPPKKPSKKMRPMRFLRFLYAVLKTFELKKLRLNVDTGDFVTNSWLVPIFLFSSRPNVILTTNYTGDIDFKLDIQNRLIRLIPPLTKLILRTN